MLKLNGWIHLVLLKIGIKILLKKKKFIKIIVRVATNMIEQAFQDKIITEEVKNLVEPTSGNTGLGLIHIGN